MRAPKKIRRLRPPGELTVEQTHDAALIAAMLTRAVMILPADVTDTAECFLIAYLGDDPVGIAGLETEVDAALIRPLFVVEKMRRRGVGACLVAAVRLAARTRGARTLYATVPPDGVNYFARFGFAETGMDDLIRAFGEASSLPQTRLDNLPACHVVRLDLSRDGLVER
jgi:N-acetylglutamate synthase-like GNAT family acetyltransferase